MHVAIKKNEKKKKKNKKNKYFFEKTRCHCNGKLILPYYRNMLYKYSLDPAKNVLHVTKLRH